MALIGSPLRPFFVRCRQPVVEDLDGVLTSVCVSGLFRGARAAGRGHQVRARDEHTDRGDPRQPALSGPFRSDETSAQHGGGRLGRSTRR